MQRAQEGESQDHGLGGRSGRRAGRALRQKSVLALALTDSLGFSFYRNFQCSSGNFLTGNFDRFVN